MRLRDRLAELLRAHRTADTDLRLASARLKERMTRVRSTAEYQASLRRDAERIRGK